MKNYLLIISIILCNIFSFNNTIINNLTKVNTILNSDGDIDIKKQIKVAKQTKVNYSAPSVGAMLLNYYHAIDEANQDYLAYQMHTNLEQEGTNADDFDQFLVNQINNEYVPKRVPIHNGNQLMAINHFIRQVYYDLENNILPILLINGYLPSFGDAWFHYLIINGIHGDILRPVTVNFEYINTRPGNRDEGTFSGFQLALLWKDNMGCYFGKNHNFH